MEPNKIRVLAVDHNPLLREGLCVLIRTQPDMELVAAAVDADQALDLFNKHRPDITLMDLDLPSGSGIKAIEYIRRIDPCACILGLLTYEWDKPARQALRAGAWCCLPKDRLNGMLVALIRDACKTH